MWPRPDKWMEIRWPTRWRAQRCPSEMMHLSRDAKMHSWACGEGGRESGKLPHHATGQVQQRPTKRTTPTSRYGWVFARTRFWWWWWWRCSSARAAIPRPTGVNLNCASNPECNAEHDVYDTETGDLMYCVAEKLDDVWLTGITCGNVGMNVRNIS